MRRQALNAVHPVSSTEWLKLQTLSHSKPPIPIFQQEEELPSALAPSSSDISDFPESEEHTVLRRPGLHVRLKRSKGYFYLFTGLVLLSLTLNDVRIGLLGKSADRWVDGGILCILAFFLFDVYLLMKTRTNYAFSVLFWLDLWATVGLISQVSLITDHIYTECQPWYFYRLGMTVKCARLSGSVIRLMRYIAMNTGQEVQLRRVESSYTHTFGSPLVKAASRVDVFSKYASINPTIPAPKVQRQSTQTSKLRIPHGGTFSNLCHQASISSKLPASLPPGTSHLTTNSRISKLITRNIVLCMVLIALLVVLWNWMHSVVIGNEEYRSMEYGLILLSDAEKTGKLQEILWEFVGMNKGENRLMELVEVSIRGTVAWENEDEYRTSELCLFSYHGFQAVYSIRLQLRLFSLFDLCETFLLTSLLICVCLSINSYFRNIVLFPLERMTETLRLIWKNPVSFMKYRPILRTGDDIGEGGCCAGKKDYGETEIRLLEMAFWKIGVMLGLVFGSAGSEMITTSIELEGNFTPLVPGKQVLAVFCFVKIGDFDRLVSSMAPGVLKYINCFSHYIHGTAERFLGAVNRNLGDSYLLLWKVPEDDQVIVSGRLVVNPFSAAVKSTTALSLLFAAKTIAKTTSSANLLMYYQQIGGGKQVNTLTFGFHIGWAYEGPIGSVFKIDASYLSPNVNMAARVETAAEQYGVKVLVSEEFYFRLGDEVKTYLRHIDTVKLKGIFSSVMLFSFDLFSTQFAFTHSRISKRKTQTQRNKLKQALEQNLITVEQMFEKSNTIKTQRTRYSQEFFQLYSLGLGRFLEGKWTEAREYFQRCLCILPDGPSDTLLTYITHYKSPPSTWAGVHELASK